MSRRFLSVSVGSAIVTVTMRRGAAVFWEATQDIADDGIPLALGALLRQVPRRRWLPTPPVVLTVGEHASRVKRLRGLPAVANSHMLDAIIRENAQQFFLWNTAFVPTSVHMLDAGEAIGGAVDATLLDSVISTCAAAGYAVRAVHPKADPRLVIHPPRQRTQQTTVPTWRARIAATVAVGAFAAAVVAPGLAADHVARKAGGELAAVAAAEARTLAAAQARRRLTDELAALARFEDNRRSSTQLLASLADALPAGSAMAELRVDSVGAELVVIAASVPDVLSAIDRMPGVDAAEIVGAVQRTDIEGRSLERAMLRLRYDPRSAQDSVRISYPLPSQATE